MTVIVNPMALSWKHNSAPGIRCAENAQGQMELTGWPVALVAYPSQAQVDTWKDEYLLVDAKTKRLTALGALAATKLALGWTYGGKVYQCHGYHLANMERFINAYSYFKREIPGWVTLTAYVTGDKVQGGGVLYKAVSNHTSGVWLTDLGGGLWVPWFFHPKKDGDGKWRALDNSMNTLTLAQCKTMCEGAVNYAMSIQAQAVVHKDAINAFSTAVDVNAYDITTNWPTNT